MAEIRWFRVIIAFLICAAILGGVSYWQVQNDPLSKIDIDLALKGARLISVLMAVVKLSPLVMQGVQNSDHFFGFCLERSNWRCFHR